MYRDLTLFLEEKEPAETGAPQALALAKAMNARITGVALGPVPFYQEYFIGAVMYDGYQQELSRMKTMAQERAASFTALAEKTGADSEVRTLVADVDLLPMDAAVQGRYADVNIISCRSCFADTRLWDRLVQSLLFNTGRPLLVMPRHAKPSAPPRTIAIAWNASAQANRAVHDAMPLIAAAQTVHVIMIDPQSSEEGHGDEPGTDIARHLARWNSNVVVSSLPDSGKPIGGLMQQAAVDRSADLLVMGAYGHSRVWEILLGGATQEVLEDSQLPTLLAH